MVYYSLVRYFKESQACKFINVLAKFEEII